MDRLTIDVLMEEMGSLLYEKNFCAYFLSCFSSVHRRK